MSIIGKLVNAFSGTGETPGDREPRPDRFFARRGRIDYSDMSADTRRHDQKHASGYDDDPVFITYESDEPKKLFVDQHGIMEDGYCLDVHFLLKNLYQRPHGDVLSNLDDDPFTWDDHISWRAFGKRGVLGFSYGDLEVRFDREEKEYSVTFECTDGIMVYGHRYVARGFESQAEVMGFLTELDEEMRVAAKRYWAKRDREKQEILAEAV